MKARHGSTLIELLATLAVMAIVASVVTLAIRPPDRAEPSALAKVQSARRHAIASRQRHTIEVDSAGVRALATALPDGSVIADSALGIDRLTGASRGGRR